MCGGEPLAAGSYQLFSVTLLQSEVVIEKRVSVQDLAKYIQDIEASLKREVSTSHAGRPTAGFVVVAVRPHLKSKV